MRRLREVVVRRVARISAEETGVVALIVAICLPLFVVLLAFAVDVSNWYLVQQQEQKAADNASLSGVIYLPDNVCSAYSTAFSVVGLNGYPVTAPTCTPSGPPSSQSASSGAYTVNVALGSKPGQLVVQISKNVHNAFASGFGTPSTTVTMSATAAFSGPANLGSPCNILGNQQMESSSNQVTTNTQCQSDGTYWLNMAGYNLNKSRGDAISTGWCTLPDDGAGIDGCTGTNRIGDGTVAGTPNTEYDPTGYLFQVQIPSAVSSGTHLQVYDGEYAEVGDTCSAAQAVWTTPTAATSARNPYVTASDAASRYALPSGTKPFCAGDNADWADSTKPDSKWSPATSGQDDSSPVQTTFTLYKAPISPSNPLSGGVVGASCPQVVIQGYSDTQIVAAGGLYALLNQTSAAYRANGGQFASFFQRWNDVCPSALAAGTYVLQVQTTANGGAVGGGGQNRFSLRAYSGGSVNSANQGVSISALEHVSLYVNSSSGSTFHAVRLDSGAAGHVLTIGLFDFGDASEPTTVQINTPDNSSNAWNPANACSGAAYPGYTGTGIKTGTLSGCSWTTTKDQSGGRWQYIKIQIPDNYTCNVPVSDPTYLSKCWVTVKLTNGGTISDTTTWSAQLSGDPVRLVQ